MVKGVVAHIRRQPVAFVALFFALGGTAVAGTGYLTRSDKITKGDLAGSTYGNPLIAAGKVTNTKLANSSLSVTTDGATLTGGGSISLGGSNSTPLGVAGGGIGTTQLADGSVTTSKFAPGAQAPNSAELGGASPSDYGAALSGRVDGLNPNDAGGDGGAVSGMSTASSSIDNFWSLSPNHDLKIRDFSVQLTAAPGSGAQWTIGLSVNNLFLNSHCVIADTNRTCNFAGPVDVPAASTLGLVFVPSASPTPNTSPDALFGFRLTDS